MKIEIEQHPDISALVVTEGLIGDEADDLVSTVQQILEKGTRKFVVDLEAVGRIDSGGLGSLFVAYTSVVKLGGRMVLVLSEKFFNPDMLVISQLVPVFEIYRSREEAIEALLDPASKPHQFEPGARQKRETTQSGGPEISACLIIPLAVSLLSGLISLAVWLIVAMYHFFT